MRIAQPAKGSTRVGDLHLNFEQFVDGLTGRLPVLESRDAARRQSVDEALGSGVGLLFKDDEAGRIRVLHPAGAIAV